jgi:hypothetical protein
MMKHINEIVEDVAVLSGRINGINLHLRDEIEKHKGVHTGLVESINEVKKEVVSQSARINQTNAYIDEEKGKHKVVHTAVMEIINEVKKEVRLYRRVFESIKLMLTLMRRK